MNIVVCTDHNYIMPCGVLLYSLCKNNLENKIIYNVVIDESVTDSDKNSLIEISSLYLNVKVVFYDIDGHLFDSFPSLGPGVYVTKATYYRLYLQDLLPINIDKVLYLDCDMIVRKDISALWNINLDNVAVAAVMDGMNGMIELYNRLNYPIEKGYFNAGMLLINLSYWREHDVLGKCLEFVKQNYDKIESHDQDVLNFVLQDSKKNVSISYNFGECFLYRPEAMQFDYQKCKEEIDKVISDPAIIHYTISKPWKESCINPFRHVFLKYRDETTWKDMPLQKNKVSWGNWREMIKEVLYKLGLIHRVVENPFRNIDFVLK